VQTGGQQRGTGGRLFAQTRTKAQAAGVQTIDATIRKENTGGRRFCDRLGFTDYRDEPERVCKRYDLA
jgi:L-amino acid N-acyltransferase YncA